MNKEPMEEKKVRFDGTGELNNIRIQSDTQEPMEWDCFDETNKKIFEICNRPMMGNWSVMQSCRDVKDLIKQAEERGYEKGRKDEEREQDMLNAGEDI